MKKTIQIALTFATLALMPSCRRSATAAGCSATTEFKNIANSNPGIPKVSMDAQIHAYSFEVTAAKTVCKIGYQNQTGVANLNYTIEIFDATSNQPILSQSKVFATNAMDYLTPTNTVNLLLGHIYWLKRIQASNNLMEQIGGLSNSVQTAGFPFPMTNGSLKILDVQFTTIAAGIGSGFTGGDLLPNIDIQFQ